MVEDNIVSYKNILKVAGPLVLQMSGVMIMQLIDALFLSRYSAEAVAAAITAGLASWLIICVFNGTAGFTSTLVAQYAGAGQGKKIPALIINGLYFSFVSSFFISGITLFSDVFFSWAGHAPVIRKYETVFFNITCYGAFFNVAGAAVAGYFSGRGKTTILMFMQILSVAINIFLDYLLIFGNCGFPKLGVAGAAWATVAAQACGLIVLVIAFFAPGNKMIAGLRGQLMPDLYILNKLLKFGFPSGIRAFIDMLAWTIFPFFIGRLGTMELAASNIAFRINAIVFLPVIGFSIAVSILVGQAQGARRPDLSVILWKRGLLICEAFTAILAITYIILPYQFYLLFHNVSTMSEYDFTKMVSIGTVMLKCVAIYCFFDTANIITLGLLQGAGDTRWTMICALSLYAVFITVLFVIDHFHGSFQVIWVAATIFIMLQSFVWFIRLLSGAWKKIDMVAYNENNR
jgi:multidrug resistance protein, MATE family